MAFGVGTACIATKQTYVAKGNKFYDAGKYDDASLNYLQGHSERSEIRRSPLSPGLGQPSSRTTPEKRTIRSFGRFNWSPTAWT